MGERELFNEVFKQLKETYNFEIYYPYGDGYFEIINKSGKKLGGMNPSGHNLLSNLDSLCKLLKEDLY